MKSNSYDISAFERQLAFAIFPKLRPETKLSVEVSLGPGKEWSTRLKEEVVPRVERLWSQLGDINFKYLPLVKPEEDRISPVFSFEITPSQRAFDNLQAFDFDRDHRPRNGLVLKRVEHRHTKWNAIQISDDLKLNDPNNPIIIAEVGGPITCYIEGITEEMLSLAGIMAQNDYCPARVIPRLWAALPALSFQLQPNSDTERFLGQRIVKAKQILNWSGR